MSKHLPKATSRSFSEIQRERVAPQVIDAVPERVAPEPEEAPYCAPEPVLVRESSSGLRRAEAELIVERHTSYAALGGCLPLAVFDALSVGLIIFNMVRELAAHYRVPFRQDQAKAIITALLGGVLSPGLGSVAGHLLGKIIPGGWLFGVAASSATAAAFTRYSGETFIEHFESGGNLIDIDLSGLRHYFSRQTAS
ncbi:MAG: hypothetical protein BWY57_01307 [Betaproteobacteria bacterium ADurb.Bin341]|nr:MAG: hypothetical protein BWY57_01307 [Betaproteobacteria bacterium ADurb.Bin341]